VFLTIFCRDFLLSLLICS